MNALDQNDLSSPSAAIDLRNLCSKLPYLALLLPVLLILPGIFSFPYPTHGESDLAISHYPNAIYLLDTLSRYGEVPLWSPAILSGYPFFADPLAGLWYPPGWLALVFPLPLGFNLLVALHLVWGGLGMTWLLRREGLGKLAALSGGVAFACLPKLYAHFGAGHLTLLYAVPWTPWLLAAYLHSQNPSQHIVYAPRTWWSSLAKVIRFLLPGIVLAFIFLADVRWAAYAGVLWWAYAFAQRGGRSRWSVLTRLLVQTIFAGLLSAPLALPLLEYTRLSTRAGLLPADILEFSLPPARLIWLFFPDFGGFHEYMLYPGAVVLVLALCGIAIRGGNLRGTFWLGAFLASLLFALGDYLPGMEYLVSLTGLDLLRVPSRVLFISGMALAALSAYGLENLLGQPVGIERSWLARVLVAFSALALALMVGLWLTSGLLPPDLVWGAAAILLGCLLVLLFSRKSNRNKWLLLGLLFLAVADWSLVDRLAYTPRPVEQVLAQGADAADFLAAQPGRFRTYSPSYSLPQQIVARYRLELADGVDPLQLAAYAGFMDRATGVPRGGYSVTIPPYTTGSPRIDNQDYIPDANMLGLLGVRYMLSEYDLDIGSMPLVHRFNETRLYENALVRPMAWIQPVSSPIGEHIQPVTFEEWQPNQIYFQASGPGLLVLSEIAYPGWRAWVDEAEVEVEAASGLLRTVRLGPGEHSVVFRFMPASLFWGFVVLIAGVILLPGFLCSFFAIKKD